ncbi:MAG: Gram-negative bacterial TonB protein C-terminal [Pseudomonadota bacterium]|jgi:hypothetical protein
MNAYLPLLAVTVLCCACGVAGTPTDPYGLRPDPANELARMEFKHCRPDDVDIKPVLLSGRRPLYPLGEEMSRRSGEASVEFEVSAKGGVRVLSTTGSGPYFRSHAEIAMRDWHVTPARRQGSAVDSICKIMFTYITHEESRWQKIESKAP